MMDDSSGKGGPALPVSPGLRVLLADESPLALRALRAELQRLDSVKIIGEASQSRETMDLFFRFHPEVVVMSVCLPDLGGFEVLRILKQVAPNCAVILTSRWPNSFVKEAGRILGATAVCQAPDGLEPLSEILQRLMHKDRDEPA
jgi:DNA-binding NarL/FixJ family response regulator